MHKHFQSNMIQKIVTTESPVTRDGTTRIDSRLASVILTTERQKQHENDVYRFSSFDYRIYRRYTAFQFGLFKLTAASGRPSQERLNQS
jgi:hypothetical protein